MKKKLKFSTEQPAIDDLKLISVKISKRTDSSPEILGTGTIVCDGVDFYVITAAHCFRDKDGRQNCEKKDIILTLYDEQYNPTDINVKELELSDPDKDTAIISINTPPGGYGYYFETLRLLGKELDGEGFVFGYTAQRPEGRLFTYKRVNTNIWTNKDDITEKGEDFFKTVKGSSGGGMFVEINDRVYCMGFIRSTFDQYSMLDDVRVQPINLVKTDWRDAYFPSIEEALERPQYDSSNDKLQQECIQLWREVYVSIKNKKDLSCILTRIKDIRKRYAIPKNVSPQNDVMLLLFRRQEPWSEEYQELFLMALEDQGMWPKV